MGPFHLRSTTGNFPAWWGDDWITTATAHINEDAFNAADFTKEGVVGGAADGFTIGFTISDPLTGQRCDVKEINVITTLTDDDASDFSSKFSSSDDDISGKRKSNSDRDDKFWGTPKLKTEAKYKTSLPQVETSGYQREITRLVKSFHKLDCKAKKMATRSTGLTIREPTHLPAQRENAGEELADDGPSDEEEARLEVGLSEAERRKRRAIRRGKRQAKSVEILLIMI